MSAWELQSAFPSSLALPVSRVTARLELPGVHAPVGALQAVVDGETLTIPGRVYFDPGCLVEAQALPPTERLILLCVFSRHHDGHVREECLRAIVGNPEPWVAPFVVQLVGEYVLEIVEVIKANLPALAPDTYAGFVAANRAFMALTRQRATSYWDCYFRRSFPNRAGLASLEILDHLESLATRDAPVVGANHAVTRRAACDGNAGGAVSSSSSIPGELWRHDLNQRPTIRSIVAPDLLLVQERQTFLTRLDPASGVPLWSAKVQNPFGWLAEDRNHVYYLNQHSVVQCNERRTRAALWSTTLRGTNGWLVAAGPTVLVGGWRGYSPLTALDANTGEVRWQLGGSGNERLSAPVVGTWGVAVASLGAPVLRFLDPASGALGSVLPLPAHGRDAVDAPLLRRSGDWLLLAGRDGRYHALSGPDGAWEVLFTHAPGILTVCPPVLDAAIVFLDGTARLNCYSLVSRQRRWSAAWAHGRQDRLAAALSSAGLLAVASADGRLAVFDSNGSQLWSAVVARRIETDIAWLNDQTIATGTTGALVAVRPDWSRLLRPSE